MTGNRLIDGCPVSAGRKHAGNEIFFGIKAANPEGNPR